MLQKNITKNIPQPIGVEPRQDPLNFFRGVDPKRLSIIILVVLAVLGMYGSYYFYGKYRAIMKNPNLEAQKEAETLVAALGKLMELPVGETPTIATISDREKLNDQIFFKAAENGDKLFAYNTAMIAILYRPSTNKIINVAPISINQPPNGVQDAKQSTSTPVNSKNR